MFSERSLTRAASAMVGLFLLVIALIAYSLSVNFTQANYEVTPNSPQNALVHESSTPTAVDTSTPYPTWTFVTAITLTNTLAPTQTLTLAPTQPVIYLYLPTNTQIVVVEDVVQTPTDTPVPTNTLVPTEIAVQVEPNQTLIYMPPCDYGGPRDDHGVCLPTPEPR